MKGWRQVSVPQNVGEGKVKRGGGEGKVKRGGEGGGGG